MAPAVAPALSLHDALPISHQRRHHERAIREETEWQHRLARASLGEREENEGDDRRRDQRDDWRRAPGVGRDRKSTRLNSSHVEISYAVFCLKKKKRAIGSD